jgi:hypothetical protein
MTWGDTYRRYLAKGHDHGSAAYEADRAERRAQRRQRREIQRLSRGLVEYGGFVDNWMGHAEELGLKLEAAEEALRAAQEAIGVWVCTYADDVGEADLERARERIRANGGTLAYTARVSELIAEALNKIRK